MKFERLDAAQIPGTRKEETVVEDAPADEGVDLAAIVNKLRNVTEQRQIAPVEGELAPQSVQAGDPGYRKTAFTVAKEPSDFNYGPPPGEAVWRRPHRS
jgi:hypothetical protein